MIAEYLQSAEKLNDELRSFGFSCRCFASKVITNDNGMRI